MTKEEILEAAIQKYDCVIKVDDGFSIIDMKREAVIEAMDEYANTTSKNFYIWAVTRAFNLTGKETLSVDELFDLYIQSLTP